MVISVGVDVVDIGRMERALARTPALLDRVFGSEDQSDLSHSPDGSSLAARFAAKEATLKALGGHIEGFHWHDIQVSRAPHQAPRLVVRGGAGARAEQLGISRWHLSLSHDGGVAIAFVVAETGESRA